MTLVQVLRARPTVAVLKQQHATAPRVHVRNALVEVSIDVDARAAA